MPKQGELSQKVCQIRPKLVRCTFEHCLRPFEVKAAKELRQRSLPAASVQHLESPDRPSKHVRNKPSAVRTTTRYPCVPGLGVLQVLQAFFW